MCKGPAGRAVLFFDELMEDHEKGHGEPGRGSSVKLAPHSNTSMSHI